MGVRRGPDWFPETGVDGRHMFHRNDDGAWCDFEGHPLREDRLRDMRVVRAVAWMPQGDEDMLPVFTAANVVLDYVAPLMDHYGHRLFAKEHAQEVVFRFYDLHRQWAKSLPLLTRSDDVSRDAIGYLCWSLRRYPERLPPEKISAGRDALASLYPCHVRAA